MSKNSHLEKVFGLKAKVAPGLREKALNEGFPVRHVELDPALRKDVFAMKNNAAAKNHLAADLEDTSVIAGDEPEGSKAKPGTEVGWFPRWTAKALGALFVAMVLMPLFTLGGVPGAALAITFGTIYSIIAALMVGPYPTNARHFMWPVPFMGAVLRLTGKLILKGFQGLWNLVKPKGKN